MSDAYEVRIEAASLHEIERTGVALAAEARLMAAELLDAREALRAADALAEAVGGCDALDDLEDDFGVRATFAALAAYRATRTR